MKKVMTYLLFILFSSALYAQNRGFDHLYNGTFLGKTGDYEGAVDEISNAIESPIEDLSDRAKAYYNRGTAQLQLNNPESAIEDFNEAIKLKPEYERAFLNRANAYIKLGKPEYALEDLNMAISLKPEYAIAYNSRGIVNNSLNKPEQAINDFTRAVILNPEYAEAYFNRAATLKLFLKNTPACTDFNKAFELGYPVSPQLLSECKEN